MKRITSLNELLIEELADLLNAENLLVEALPKMVQDSQSSTLKALLEDHLAVTKDQADRLKDIFSVIGQDPQGVTCKTMKRIIVNSEAVVNGTKKYQSHDAAIISMAQQMEQYEITGYQTACQHAADLGHTKIVELLNETLDEERAMNFHLNELAQYMINAQAINPFGTHQGPIQKQRPLSKPKSEGFYIPEGNFKRGGIKKKFKNTDVSRFINEGNPNIQELQEKDPEDKNLQNPEEEGDLS